MKNPGKYLECINPNSVATLVYRYPGIRNWINKLNTIFDQSITKYQNSTSVN